MAEQHEPNPPQNNPAATPQQPQVARKPFVPIVSKSTAAGAPASKPAAPANTQAAKPPSVKPPASGTAVPVAPAAAKTAPSNPGALPVAKPVASPQAATQPIAPRSAAPAAVDPQQINIQQKAPQTAEAKPAAKPAVSVAPQNVPPPPRRAAAANPQATAAATKPAAAPAQPARPQVAPVLPPAIAPETIDIPSINIVTTKSPAPAARKPAAPAVHPVAVTLPSATESLSNLSAEEPAAPTSDFAFADLAVAASPKKPVAAPTAKPSTPTATIAAPAKKPLPKWAIYAGVVVLIGVWTGVSLFVYKTFFVKPEEKIAQQSSGLKISGIRTTTAEKARENAKNKKYAATVAAEKASAAEVIKQAEPSIVLITIRDKSGDELGLGSGFVINEKGQIATNYHVIENAWSADATFSHGEKRPITGAWLLDEDRDLAVLQIDTGLKPLVPLPMATALPERTDAVVAFGHPQGFAFTTSTGIVTSTYRSDQVPEPYRDELTAPADNMWIQTNAAISGGNSGGPLLNMQGQVVGINTWIGKDRPDMRFATYVGNLQTILRDAPKQPLPLAKSTGLSGEVRQVMANYTTQAEGFERQLRSAKSRRELMEILETKTPIPEHAPRLLPFIVNQKKSPVQWLALRAYLSMAREIYFPSSCDSDLAKVLDVAAQEYPDPKRQMELLFMMLGCRREPAFKYVERVAKEKTSPDLAAFANFCLAERVARSADGDVKKLDQAVSFLERIIKDFPNASIPRIGNLAGYAAARIHELTYLEVGRTAQDIEGADVRGKDFKLSDYRGKTVVLFFWADWCPHCQRMYPLMRKLVNDYKNEPLVVLGVNNDEVPNRLALLEDRKAVNWKNWYNGREGSITHDWGVEGFPTVILIDHKGVIRDMKVSPSELEESVKSLVAEATGKKPAGSDIPSWLKALGGKKDETSDAKKE